MLSVGIVGQMGTGKSTVADEFVRCGAELISGDEIGRQVVESNRGIQARLVAAFGAEIRSRNGGIERAILAEKAFAGPERLEQLNAIVHPALLKELRRQIKECRRRDTAPMVVVDAALIFQWGLEAELDVTIFVDAPRSRQLAWLKRKGISRGEALSRISLQLPKYRQRELADFELRNGGSVEDLRRRTRRLYRKLLLRFPTSSS